MSSQSRLSKLHVFPTRACDAHGDSSCECRPLLLGQSLNRVLEAAGLIKSTAFPCGLGVRRDGTGRQHAPAIITNVKCELRASLCRSRCFLFFPPRADRELPVQLRSTAKPHACSLPACFHSPASKLAEKHLRISQAPSTCSPQQLHACCLHRHLWCSCRQRSTAARGCACGA